MQFDLDNLPEFGKQQWCPACQAGRANADVEFCAAARAWRTYARIYVEETSGRNKPFLRITCRRCKFDWLEAPAQTIEL